MSGEKESFEFSPRDSLYRLTQEILLSCRLWLAEWAELQGHDVAGFNESHPQYIATQTSQCQP
ncbi:MAG: hypothetical protein H7Z17_03220 [Fuerstia sp.]|nr:hypothetical protein [Fuerstiella sp.]